MINEINLLDPDFVINCKDCKVSTDIYTFLKSYNNVVNYCYAICYMSGLSIKFLKIGQSSPEKGSKKKEIIGERLKRQLEHVPGWINDPYYHSSNGDDFWKNMSREINNGNLPILTKDNLFIGVWNLDVRLHKVDFLYKKNKEITTYVEGLLVQQYKDMNNGDKPLLNIQDPTNNKSFSETKLPTTMFSFI